jgi:Reverse transcriptase (RNA-dependent DNA polymerase)
VVGLDRAILDTLDTDVALGRIKRDLISDFIPSPHYAVVFEHAGADLFDLLRTRLISGQYEPQSPIVLEVLKASGATRPGAVLVPEDRLIYQLLADALAPVIETQIARDRVYSNVVRNPDPQFAMFEDQGQAWRSMLAYVNECCAEAGVNFVLKADVANFFERLYQHKLINLLSSAGSASETVSLLEKLLSAWTEKDSHGIPQGMFPSDILGNFYLTGVDAQLELMGFRGARFVDDIYLFFERLNTAREAMVRLCGWLRKDGLSLNEQKSGVRSADRVLHEETDLDKKFRDARDEIEAAISESGPYGGEPDPLDPDELKEIDLQAVLRLYEARAEQRASLVDRIDTFLPTPVRGARVGRGAARCRFAHDQEATLDEDLQCLSRVAV